MAEVLHENETYQVIISMDGERYEMVNKKTKITEQAGTCLPSIISESEQSNAYLLNEVWQWIRKQSDAETKKGRQFYEGDLIFEDGNVEETH